VNVQLVMWAIAELGIQHERLDFGHGHASPKDPEFLEMNPMGLVPVVTDGSVTLFESAAILRYLGAAYGSEDFWPQDPDRRAKLDSWAEWGKNTFAATVLEIFAYEIRYSPVPKDPGILARATEKLIPLSEMLNTRLADGPWLDGERFSFADIACGHILHRYFTLDWDRPERPALAAYYDRLQTRSAYTEHAMVPYLDLKGSY